MNDSQVPVSSSYKDASHRFVSKNKNPIKKSKLTLRQHEEYAKFDPRGTSEELRRFASILYSVSDEKRKIQCPYCDALNDTESRTLLVKHYFRAHINENDKKDAAYAILNIRPGPTYDFAWELGLKKIESAKGKTKLDNSKFKIFNAAIMPLVPVGENPFWPKNVPRPPNQS